MENGVNFLNKSKEFILNNEEFKKFQRLNELVQKSRFSEKESKELTSLYSNMNLVFDEIKKHNKKIVQLLKVIEERYPNLTKDKTYMFLKEISKDRLVDDIKYALKKESRFYSENNVVDWRSALNERNNIMNGLLKAIYQLQDPSIKNFADKLRILSRERIVDLFLLTDKIIIKLFPKVQEYREYGEYSSKYVDREFQKLAAKSRESYNHMMYLYNTPSYKAYMTITAQITLIDYDISGGNVRDNFNNVLKAAFKSGLDFFLIKIVDDYQDRNIMDKEALGEFFLAFERAMVGEESYQPRNIPKECQLFLDFVKELQKHLPINGERKRILNYLKRADQKFMRSHIFKSKVIYSKLVARLCADLTINNFKTYITILNPEFKNFIRDKGITGNLFDDLKDYGLDRLEGHGYAGEHRLRLFLEMLRKFSYTLFGISLKSKARLMNFCILAGLFQCRELIKIKDRT